VNFSSQSFTGIYNAGVSPSCVGLEGTAEFGSANRCSSAWRRIYGGVSDPTWGSLDLGRTINLAADRTLQYDPLQAAVLYSPIGKAGAIGRGQGVIEHTRLDNSLRYENTVGYFRFGAQYEFAGDKSAQSAASGWVGMLAFTRGAFSIEGTSRRWLTRSPGRRSTRTW
jgi:GBP family porin